MPLVNKNNGLKGLGFVGYKYCLLMKINEGRASVKQSGNGGKAVMSLCPPRIPRPITPQSCFPLGSQC